MEIFRLQTPCDPHWDALRRLLREYNKAQVGDVGASATIAFGLKNETGEAAEGGLWGEIYWNWLSIYMLIVPETLRGKGIGSRLLTAAEALAQDQGCIGAWLDTFSFQAPAFYRKHGYESFGELAAYPNGASRIFLRKRWAPPGPERLA